MSICSEGWWRTASPIHGDKFIEVSKAAVTIFDHYGKDGFPTIESKAVKTETLENTLWSIERFPDGRIRKFWQYSKKFNVNPISFDITEVVLYDELGHEIS